MGKGRLARQGRQQCQALVCRQGLGRRRIGGADCGVVAYEGYPTWTIDSTRESKDYAVRASRKGENVYRRCKRPFPSDTGACRLHLIRDVPQQASQGGNQST